MRKNTYTMRERNAWVKIREECQCGSNVIHDMILKDPAKYGIAADRVPSINTIQDEVRRRGLLTEGYKRRPLTIAFGKHADVDTDFGIIHICVTRAGVIVTDNKGNQQTFYKEDGK